MKFRMMCLRDLKSPLPPHDIALHEGHEYIATMDTDGTFLFPIENTDDTIVILRDQYPIYFKCIERIEE